MSKLDVDMIMMQAVHEAKLLQQSCLGSEHVLLSVLRNENHILSKRLNACGMNYEEVKKEVILMNGSLPKHHHKMHYSEVVDDLITQCDDVFILVLKMLLMPYSLAGILMERHHIKLENLLH